MRRYLLCISLALVAYSLHAQVTPAISWIKKNGPSGGHIIDLEIEPTSGNVFALDEGGRAYASDDDGASWERLTFIEGQESFEDIAVAGNTVFLVGYRELYAADDGSLNFAKRMTDASPYEGGQRLSQMPISGDLVLLARNGDIYTSSNDGQSWTIRGSLTGVDQGYHLAVNAVDQIFVLKSNAFFDLRPFRSSDGGTTFTEMSGGIPSGHHVNSLSAEPGGANIYCVSNEGLYKTSDGSAWTSIKTATIADVTINEVFPLNSFIEFSADGLGMYFVDNVNHKLYNKGINDASWTLRAQNFPSASSTITVAAAGNYPGGTSGTAFFGSALGVSKTITGGASVSQANQGITSVGVQELTVDGNGVLYVETSAVYNFFPDLLRSSDLGNNWTPVTTLPKPFRHLSHTDNGLFAIASSTLYRSYNEGSTWFPLTSPAGAFVWAAGLPGTTRIFALAGSGSPLALYYSPYNGNTWTAVAVAGLPASFSLDTDGIHFASPERMLVPITDYSDGNNYYYRITFTYDASENVTGAVAARLTLPIPFQDIYTARAADGKFYLYDPYSTASPRIAISEDGGASWNIRTAPESDDFFVAPNGYLFFSDGGDRKLQLSRDNALSFIETAMPPGVDGYALRDIILDDGGYAYLAFSRDFLYQSSQRIVLPDQPTNLETVGRSATAVALRWIDNNDYEHDIIIERSRNATDFTVVGQTRGWDACGLVRRGYFIDETADASTAYTYRVRANNEAGSSATTSAVAVTTLADCAPDLPDNRSWTAINMGTGGYAPLAPENAVTVGIKHLGGGKYSISNLSLGLTGQDEASEFYVSCAETLVGEINDLRPNGNGTWDGTTLTLKWYACYDNDNTETIQLTLNPVDPKPAAPVNLRGYVVSNTAIELSWPSAYFEQSYVLERSTTAAFTTYDEVATVNYPVTSFLDETGLTLGNIYYYRLKSLNGNSPALASDYSAAIAVPFRRPNFIVAANAITNFDGSATVGSLWADFDSDGFEDYFTMRFDNESQRAQPAIFRNLGTGDFEMMTPAVGEGSYLWSSVIDFDNDGNPDLALSGDNTRTFDLFTGNGDFTFTKVPKIQLGDLAVLENLIASSSWADINNDGLLDLLLINQEDGGFQLYKQNPNHTFTHIFDGTPSNDEPILSIWADYDNDGDQDVLLGNMDGTGGLHRNNGDETFTLITGNGMDAAHYLTAAWGDYNNDGNVDLFCGTTTENALYKNNGDGTFTKDVSTSISEANQAVSASWGDFNNDGFLDLLTAGFASVQTRLFIRDAAAAPAVVFRKITSEKINDLSTSHYSAATADPDRNGLLDFALSAFVFEENNDGILPTNNHFYQNNNQPLNWSEVRLIPDNGGEAIGARISLTAGGKTQTRELASLSSLASRNSLIAHFGLGNTTTISNIQVRWPGGAIQNYPIPPAGEVLVIEEDLEGPSLVSRLPAHQAAEVESTTSLTLEFNEPAFAVPAKKIYLVKSGESTAAVTINAIDGVRTGNQLLFTLATPLESSTQYHVLIDIGAFTDRYANPYPGMGSGAWAFTTRAEADVMAPVIAFTPLASTLEKGFSPVSVAVTVEDDRNVASVTLHHRKISTKSFTPLALTYNGANAKWEGQVLNTFADDMGFEYYIEASDGVNTARAPSTAATYFKSAIAFSGTPPSIVLADGGTKNAWRIISIPHELPSKQIESIFSPLGISTKTTWRMIRYTNTPAEAWEEYPAQFASIERGAGYFINTRDGNTITLNGAVAPDYTRDNLFEIQLVPGWNQIGNPYTVAINWADVKAYNPDAEISDLLKFNGTYISSDQQLAPMQGGFVEAVSAVTISIPFAGQNNPGGGRKGFADLGNDIDARSWALPLTLRQGGLTNAIGSVGMAPDASASFDLYDASTPPRFFDYLELNFSHPETRGGRLTRDIVPTGENYTWTFTVESNLVGDATLAWNNAPLLSSAKEMFLLDVGAQKLVNMKQVQAYTFHPGDAKTFRLYFGEDLSISPERVQLGKAFPNPTNGHTAVAFSLPDSGGPMQTVSLEILDPLGRPTKVIVNGDFYPGYHETTFDVRGLVSGLYTYRLIVENRNGRSTEVKKLVIK